MKKKRLAELLVQSIQHLRVSHLCCKMEGKQDYDFYKEAEQFLNNKQVSKLDIQKTAYEDLISELIKE